MDNIYKMAVEGRYEFRKLYRSERLKNKNLKKQLDHYGLALLMIREGIDNPSKLAKEILDKFHGQLPNGS